MAPHIMTAVGLTCRQEFPSENLKGCSLFCTACAYVQYIQHIHMLAGLNQPKQSRCQRYKIAMIDAYSPYNGSALVPCNRDPFGVTQRPRYQYRPPSLPPMDTPTTITTKSTLTGAVRFQVAA